MRFAFAWCWFGWALLWAGASGAAAQAPAAAPAAVRAWLRESSAQARVDTAAARRRAAQAWHAARAQGADSLAAAARMALGRVAAVRHRYAEAQTQYAAARAEFERLHLLAAQARCLRAIAAACIHTDRLAAAQAAYRQELRLWQQLGDDRGLVECLSNLGTVYQSQNDFAGAQRCYLEALRQAERTHLVPEQSLILNNLASVYDDQGNPRVALGYMQRALRIDEQRHRSVEVAEKLVGIGGLYRQLGQLSAAERCLQKGLAQLNAPQVKRQAEPVGWRAWAGMAHLDLGRLYTATRRWPLAQQHLRQARRLFDTIDMTELEAPALTATAALYQRLGRLALAQSWAEQAVRCAQASDEPTYSLDAHRLLAELCAARGNHAAAYAHALTYQRLYAAQFNQQQTRQLSELRTRYETEKQEEQIALLRRNAQLQRSEVQLLRRTAHLQARTRNLLVLALAALAAAVVATAWGYRRQQRNIALLQAQETELAANNASLTRTQLQLRKLLGEKDVLLKEVHHRVKNNLQIISGLLGLQAFDKQHAQPELGEALRESQGWVRAIALIHETLYRSDDLVRVELEPFLRQLVEALEMAFAPARAGAWPHTTVAAPNVQLNTSTAVPLGLVVNELLTNAYKHAFGPNWPAPGRVRVVLAGGPAPAEYVLTVEDNGRGLPANFDVAQATSLGLRLVHRLAEQLDGRLRFEQPAAGRGTRCTVVFYEVSETALPA